MREQVRDHFGSHSVGAANDTHTHTHTHTQIIVALTASVPPMINAFALVCLVTAIYAIVGVTLFANKSPDNFFDFFTAMFTMFQVPSQG